ncbi:MAG: hypothetical protein ABI397_02160 [Candidatus Saccharimonas sp.]
MVVPVSAAGEVYYGRQVGYGWFSGGNYYHQAYEVPGGLGEVVDAYGACAGIQALIYNAALPDSQRCNNNDFVGNLDDSYKTKFIGIIDGLRASPIQKNNTAAAFIMNIMIGNNAPGWGKNLSVAQIQQWKDAVNQSNVGMKIGKYTNKINTGYVTGSDDETFFKQSASANKQSVIFYDKTTGEVYSVIKLDCGNPLGDLGGIKLSGWSTAGDSYVTKSSDPAGTIPSTPGVPGDYLSLNPKPGDIVFFHHDLSLAGTKNDANIHWSIIGSAMLGKPQAQGDLAAGASPGGILNNWYNNYKIPLTDPDGTKYCQSVSATPGVSNSPSNVYKSTPACVTVSKDPTPASGLAPTVTLTVNGSALVDGGVADPDTKTLDVSSGVSNSGAKTPDMQWKLYMFKVSNISKQDASKFTPSSSGSPCTGVNANGNMAIPCGSAIWSHFEQREYDHTYSYFMGYTPYTYQTDGSGNYVLDKYGNKIVTGGHDPQYQTRHYTQTLCEEKIQFAGGVSGPDYDFDSQYGGGQGYIDNLVYRDPRTGDSTISHETRCRTAALRPTSTGNQSVMLSGLTPGEQLCYFTTASAINGTSNTNSKVKCLLSIAIPFTHIIGNDLRVGSALSISDNRTSVITGIMKPYGGTSSEYAALAPGLITGTGSSSGGFLGVPASQSQNLWSTLTLANENSFGQFAGSQSVGAIPNVAKFLSTSGLKGITGTGPCGATDVTIGGNSSFNQSAVICSSGTVTITGDIKYADTTSSGQIPQLIIIANKISITGKVGQVDAWLIATGGTVDTCSDVAGFSDLAFNVCDKPLTINGPIMANRLMLKRTYYNKSSLNVSAETLDLRGDAYLWANNLSRENSQWQTTYTTDLPPRY